MAAKDISIRKALNGYIISWYTDNNDNDFGMNHSEVVTLNTQDVVLKIEELLNA